MQVRLLDISIDGSETGRVMHQPWRNIVDAANAARFLADHPTAKIVVTLDTHCLEESGSFLWKGSEPKFYEACGLDEVGATYSQTSKTHLTSAQLIRDCIPEGVRQYVSTLKSVPHSHKSIIVNLSCRAAVRHSWSWETLLTGWVTRAAPISTVY